MLDGRTTQATTLTADAPGREMRHARWVPSWPAPAEGERLISTEQVSLLEGLDRDMHEWERQDGDGCGTQQPKAKGSSARGVCSCGGQHARGKSTALNARERRQSHTATGERLSSSTAAKKPGATREWHAARARGSTRTHASGRRARGKRRTSAWRAGLRWRRAVSPRARPRKLAGGRAVSGSPPRVSPSSSARAQEARSWGQERVGREASIGREGERGAGMLRGKAHARVSRRCWRRRPAAWRSMCQTA